MTKSISEEFKDQKINEILEDYIALEKKIDEIPLALSTKIDEVTNAIRETPKELDNSLKKIAIAIENAEKSTQKLVEESEAAIKNRAINEIDETKKKISLSINDIINSHIGEQLRETRNILKEINNQSQKKADTALSKKSFSIIILLIISTVFFASSCLYLLADIKKTKEYALKTKLQNTYQTMILQRLPKSVQQKYNSEALILDKEIEERIKYK